MEIVLSIIASLLLFYSFYGLLFVVLGTTYRFRTRDITELPKIRVLLPAYKPDKVFLQVLQSLKTAIGQHPLEVEILFQNADEEIVSQSRQYGFKTHIERFDHLPGNSYHHALHYLLEHAIQDEDDYVVIFDKDNLVDSNFFHRLASAQLTRYDVLQGIRRPLQTGEGIQIFDAMSERYNDLMLRKGKCVLGGVLEVSGSAAVIRASLFKSAVAHLDAKAPGYDKNFMVNLLTGSKSLVTGFDDQMMVFEEKTAEVANYRSQRLRWFGEQYFNALYHAKSLLSRAITHLDWKCLDYWITLMRPPRSLQMVLAAAMVVVDLLDLTLSWYSLPFLGHALSLSIVARPLVNRNNIKQLLYGAWKVIWSNAVTAMNSMRKKYLGVFIHTR